MDKENRQNGNFQTNSTKAFRENINKAEDRVCRCYYQIIFLIYSKTFAKLPKYHWTVVFVLEMTWKILSAEKQTLPEVS